MNLRLRARVTALDQGGASPIIGREWERVMRYLTDADLDRLEAMPELGRPVSEARDATSQIVDMLKAAAERIGGSAHDGAATCLALAATLHAQLFNRTE